MEPTWIVVSVREGKTTVTELGEEAARALYSKLLDHGGYTSVYCGPVAATFHSGRLSDRSFVIELLGELRVLRDRGRVTDEEMTKLCNRIVEQINAGA